MTNEPRQRPAANGSGKTAIGSLGIVAAIALSGCSDIHISDARLYNVNNDMLSTAHLYALDKRYGRVTVTLPSGEHLQGDFTLTDGGGDRAPAPEIVRLVYNDSAPGVRGAPLNLSPVAAERPLATLFGYKHGDKAVPLAVATLVGGRGTALEMVFYTLDVKHDAGSGVARDNKGNWYLIRLGM